MQITEDLMNKLLFVFFLLTGLAVQSQSVLKGSLIDQVTKQPIPFATIKVLHRPFGSFTNDKGNFEVEAFPNDTLFISSIGFVSKKVTGFADTIFLQPLVKELPPVVISRKLFISTHTLGINAIANFQWGPSGYGEEFAQKINLNLSDDEYCQVKKVIFSVKRFESETPALLHIYSVNPISGLPQEELLSKKYVLSKNHFRKERITIDISSEKLYVNDSSIFVSFEWLGYGKADIAGHKSFTTLNMTTEVAQILTYTRTLRYSSYHWFPAPQINGKVTNTIFQIEVDKLK
jgi:hypothetical protein